MDLVTLSVGFALGVFATCAGFVVLLLILGKSEDDTPNP